MKFIKTILLLLLFLAFRQATEAFVNKSEQINLQTDISFVADIENCYKRDLSCTETSKSCNYARNLVNYWESDSKSLAKGADVVELTVNGKLIGKFSRGSSLEVIDDVALHGGNKIILSTDKTTTITGTIDDVNTVAKRGVNADGSFNGITAAGQANKGGINILRSPEWGTIKAKYKSMLDAGDELGYWKKVTDEFWETVNKPWLDEAISRGDNLRFVSNPNSDFAIYVTKGNNFVLDAGGNKIKSIFGREIDYLKSKGYTILSDGTAIK